jgi:glycosyltransferase involved in cell wall biosynthesis
MEISSMGIPVVATNIRGCRTAVDDGRTGLLVPLKDSSALADAIARLLDDRALRATMGNEGRRVALARFDEREIFNKVLTTYDRLLTARGLRS